MGAVCVSLVRRNGGQGSPGEAGGMSLLLWLLFCVFMASYVFLSTAKKVC